MLNCPDNLLAFISQAPNKSSQGGRPRRDGVAWDPGQYLKFAGERLRPGFELLARVGDLPSGPLYDLGCGTGAHARAIAARWPERSVTGVDRSAEMLAQAAAEPSAVEWRLGDIARWSSERPAALIYANAALHWVGDHPQLFPRLVAQLAPGGVLAVQMPENFSAPSHVLLNETATSPPWGELLRAARADLLAPDPVLAPIAYFDLLAPLAAGGIDLWETIYLHVLEGEDPVLEWVRGTALRPILAALPAKERAGFAAAYAAKLRSAYPRRRDGHTLLPFRRLFLVARR
jgi:trans-aconitate 2-methyltransferase